MSTSPTYRLVYTREFARQIRRLDRHVKGQIEKALEKIRLDPTLGKKLTGILADRWSFRSGDYRILYRIQRDQLVILVLTVGHRKDVYR